MGDTPLEQEGAMMQDSEGLAREMAREMYAADHADERDFTPFMERTDATLRAAHEDAAHEWDEMVNRSEAAGERLVEVERYLAMARAVLPVIWRSPITRGVAGAITRDASTSRPRGGEPDLTRHRVVDLSTEEEASAHSETTFILDDPYLVFTLDGRDIYVAPHLMVRGKILTVHMGGAEFRELRVL